MTSKRRKLNIKSSVFFDEQDSYDIPMGVFTGPKKRKKKKGKKSKHGRLNKFVKGIGTKKNKTTIVKTSRTSSI